MASDGYEYISLRKSFHFGLKTYTNLFCRISDFELEGSISIKENTDDLAKDEWQKFWLLFNLVQGIHISGYSIFTPEAPDSDREINVEEILELFSPELHPVIRELLNHDIDFDMEGGYSLTNESWNKIPEAQLGLEEYKIIFMPLDEYSKSKFIEAGYTVVDPASFNIEMLKK